MDFLYFTQVFSKILKRLSFLSHSFMMSSYKDSQANLKDVSALFLHPTILSLSFIVIFMIPMP